MPTNEAPPNQPQPKTHEDFLEHEKFLGNVKTLWDSWKKDGRAGLEKALEEIEEK